MAREPMVPVSVFTQMTQALSALFEREAEARRAHEVRIAQIIGDALKPAVVPEPAFTGRAWVRDEEEDLAFQQATGGLSEELKELLQAEAEFDKPIRDQFHITD
jgi:hypothetical protein